VIVTGFDPRGELIVIKGTIWSAQGRARDVELAVDTGASETLIIPEVTDALGYGARDGEAITVIRGLNFLRNFDYEVRSILGQLRVDHASSVP